MCSLPFTSLLKRSQSQCPLHLGLWGFKRCEWAWGALGEATNAREWRGSSKRGGDVRLPRWPFTGGLTLPKLIRAAGAMESMCTLMFQLMQCA